MEGKFGKFVTGKAFPAIFSLLMVGLVLYSGIRVGRAFWEVWNIDLYIPVFLITFALLWFSGWARRDTPYSRVYQAAVWISGLYICWLVYFLMALFAADVLCLFLRMLGKWNAGPAASTFLALAVAVGAVTYGVIHAKTLKTLNYSVRLGSGEKQYRLAFLSDLHFGTVVGSGHMKKVTDRVNELAPDMVVVTGDIFNRGSLKECSDLDKIAEQFRRLQARDGVFAVLGNHDPDRSDPKLQDFLSKSGIRLLDNDLHQTEAFNLVGRTGTEHMRDKRLPLEELLRRADPEKPSIILDHDPQGIREAARRGADLVLCGHTHRGQFFPITVFTRWANGKHYFYGYETFGKTQAIISAGTGYFQLPIRIGTDSEVISIELRV